MLIQFLHNYIHNLPPITAAGSFDSTLTRGGKASLVHQRSGLGGSKYLPNTKDVCEGAMQTSLGQAFDRWWATAEKALPPFMAPLASACTYVLLSKWQGGLENICRQHIHLQKAPSDFPGLKKGNAIGLVTSISLCQSCQAPSIFSGEDILQGECLSACSQKHQC